MSLEMSRECSFKCLISRKEALSGRVWGFLDRHKTNKTAQKAALNNNAFVINECYANIRKRTFTGVKATKWSSDAFFAVLTKRRGARKKTVERLRAIKKVVF